MSSDITHFKYNFAASIINQCLQWYLPDLFQKTSLRSDYVTVFHNTGQLSLFLLILHSRPRCCKKDDRFQLMFSRTRLPSTRANALIKLENGLRGGNCSKRQILSLVWTMPGNMLRQNTWETVRAGTSCGWSWDRKARLINLCSTGHLSQRTAISSDDYRSCSDPKMAGLIIGVWTRYPLTKPPIKLVP